jgi:type II secretory pathway component PulK
MNMHLLIKTRRPHRRRSGYMLLVCTLAVTVLSMASIAIIRSSQHQIRLVDAQRSTVQGRATADGLYQRAIAVLRDSLSIRRFKRPACERN